MMARRSNYDKFPSVAVRSSSSVCQTGWTAIVERLRGAISDRNARVVCVECYPGVSLAELERVLTEGLNLARVINTGSLLKSPERVEAMVAPYLGDDPVFGRMNGIVLEDFFEPALLASARRIVQQTSEGVTLVIGTGAALIALDPDLLVYADMARWEIQRRQRRGEIGNLGVNNLKESPSLKYKRAFFIDWRVADRLKKTLLPQHRFLTRYECSRHSENDSGG